MRERALLLGFAPEGERGDAGDEADHHEGTDEDHCEGRTVHGISSAWSKWAWAAAAATRNHSGLAGVLSPGAGQRAVGGCRTGILDRNSRTL